MTRVVVVLCAIFACLSLTIAPADCFATQCDTLPPRAPFYLDSLGVFQFAGGANCWGYIAPDGTEYAIIGTQSGIGVVNVSTMSVVGTVPAQPCSWRELKTYRHYCYVVSECLGLNEGMMIVDLQYLPDSLHFVGSYVRPDQTNKRSHCISIDTARGFCYLVRQNYSGFRIVSLASPEAPVDVGSAVTGDLHDMTAFNDTVYTAEGNDHDFGIWNCTNKSSPVEIVNISVPNGGYVHNIWPTSDREVLATTEETSFKTVKIWSAANLANIQLISQYLGPSNLAHNAHFEDDYLYISHYESGVSVLDLTVPECPVEVALFDTYEPSNNPQFDGCWGVYPHTAGRRHVYASNIDGRFFIFGTSAVSVEFSGSPTVGAAPLNVGFADQSPLAAEWKWYFGDGDSSLTQSPTHTYSPGLYPVTLQITTSEGDTGIEIKQNFVTALAETLKVADTAVAVNVDVMREIWYHNYVPLAEIKLPIDLSNSPEIATFDSVTTSGCRTSYFEQKLTTYDNRPNGQLAIKLKADAGGGIAPLPPGDGPILRVWFHANANAQIGQQIALTMPPMGFQLQQILNAFTVTTSYIPSLIVGTATVSGVCNCLCHADPVCDGVPDVLDVTETVNAAFRGFNALIDPDCPHAGRQDIDCSNSIDILDVVSIVTIVFRAGDPATLSCDPCAL